MTAHLAFANETLVFSLQEELGERQRISPDGPEERGRTERSSGAGDMTDPALSFDLLKLWCQPECGDTSDTGGPYLRVLLCSDL